MRPATSEHLPDPATHVTHVSTAGSGDESGGEGCLCRLCFTRQRRLGQTLLTQRPLGSSIPDQFPSPRWRRDPLMTHLPGRSATHPVSTTACVPRRFRTAMATAFF